MFEQRHNFKDINKKTVYSSSTEDMYIVANRKWLRIEMIHTKKHEENKKKHRFSGPGGIREEIIICGTMKHIWLHNIFTNALNAKNGIFFETLNNQKKYSKDKEAK